MEQTASISFQGLQTWVHSTICYSLTSPVSTHVSSTYTEQPCESCLTCISLRLLIWVMKWNENEQFLLLRVCPRMKLNQAKAPRRALGTEISAHSAVTVIQTTQTLFTYSDKTHPCDHLYYVPIYSSWPFFSICNTWSCNWALTGLQRKSSTKQKAQRPVGVWKHLKQCPSAQGKVEAQKGSWQISNLCSNRGVTLLRPCSE